MKDEIFYPSSFLLATNISSSETTRCDNSTHWYSLAKNTTYFALKHGYQKLPLPIFLIRLTLLLIYRCLLRILRLKFTHNLPFSLLGQYIQESILGVCHGWEAGIKLHNFKEKKWISGSDLTLS